MQHFPFLPFFLSYLPPGPYNPNFRETGTCRMSGIMDQNTKTGSRGQVFLKRYKFFGDKFSSQEIADDENESSRNKF